MRVETFLHGAWRSHRRRPFSRFDLGMTAGVGLAERCVGTELIATDQAFSDTSLQHLFEEMVERVVVAETTVVVLREAGMIRDRVGEVEPTKPPVAKLK